MSKARIKPRRRWPVPALIAASLVVAVITLPHARPNVLSETISFTPWADAVSQSSDLIGVQSAARALGAPDNQMAQLLGVNSTITLDMGASQGGTGPLKIYNGPLLVVVNGSVEFLDNSSNLITAIPLTLGVNAVSGDATIPYSYAATKKAYRYVRLKNFVTTGINLDAVQALSYIGATAMQDTDGDGVADRAEINQGSDPAAFNVFAAPTPPPVIVPTNAPNAPNPFPVTSASGATTASVSTNGSSSTNRDSSPRTAAQSQAATSAGLGETVVPVNAVPAPADDIDADGMSDAWEKNHKLSITNAADAKTDSDGDGLSNLAEYVMNTDPQSKDSDGDGMDDKWEVDNQLNPEVNDAEADPDNDFITNKGEAEVELDPHKWNNLKTLVAAAKTTQPSTWPWWGWLLAAVGVTVVALGGILFDRMFAYRLPQQFKWALGPKPRSR